MDLRSTSYSILYVYIPTSPPLPPLPISLSSPSPLFSLTPQAEQADSDITDISTYVDIPSGWSVSDTTLSETVNALDTYVDVPSPSPSTSLSASVSALSDYVSVPSDWTDSDDTLSQSLSSLLEYVAIPDAWVSGTDTTLTQTVADIDTYVEIPASLPSSSLSDTVSALSAYVGTKPGTWEAADTLSSKADSVDTTTASLSTSLASLQDYVDIPSAWTSASDTLTDTVSALSAYVARPSSWTASDTTLSASVSTLDSYVAVPDAWTASDDTLTKQVEDVWLMDYDTLTGQVKDFFTTDTAGMTFDWEGTVYWSMYTSRSPDHCFGYVEAKKPLSEDWTIVSKSTVVRNDSDGSENADSSIPLHIQPGIHYRLVIYDSGVYGTCSSIAVSLKR
ncbi:hypothetical protein KIPB_008647 [Kipferlia bialata]|uniref:Uncharacterized protein n=1 Tax=Kipferlia bialata TaxID=797122 RepID=A0A391NT49_9EUKA|nr:hypothetical protein KIPB_008647 [Kipferlia bialata]|eukprot:g8647.t1